VKKIPAINGIRMLSAVCVRSSQRTL